MASSIILAVIEICLGLVGRLPRRPRHCIGHRAAPSRLDHPVDHNVTISSTGQAMATMASGLADIIKEDKGATEMSCRSQQFVLLGHSSVPYLASPGYPVEGLPLRWRVTGRMSSTTR